jgi:hypothetical protein
VRKSDLNRPTGKSAEGGVTCFNKCNFEAAFCWLLTIDGKQKPCQYDNRLTRAPLLII